MIFTIFASAISELFTTAPNEGNRRPASACHLTYIADFFITFVVAKA